MKTKIIQFITPKLHARPLLKNMLVITPVVIGLSAVSVVLYAQSAPPTVHLQETAGKHSSASAATAPIQKTATTTTPAKPAATPAPAAAKTTPKKTTVQAGTPKAEPVVTPSPASSVSGLTPTTTPTPPSQQTPSSQIATGYTSTNWSGYLATSGVFTGVNGAWIATDPSGNGSTITADSTWIGIGGVTSGDLIQVGTQNIISASGQDTTAAFYEMLPAVSQTVPGVTVNPGDSMVASLTETAGGQWNISITDQTDGESFSTNVSYSSSLSSAEWIEEDPSFSFRRQIPFDNFHEAAFSGGATTVSGTLLTIAASTAQPVIMVDSSGQTVIAQPSAIGGDGASFTVTP